MGHEKSSKPRKSLVASSTQFPCIPGEAFGSTLATPAPEGWSVNGPRNGLLLEMVQSGRHLIDNVIWAKGGWDKGDGSVEGRCMIEPVRERLNGNGWEFFHRFRPRPEKMLRRLMAPSRIPRKNGRHAAVTFPASLNEPRDLGGTDGLGPTSGAFRWGRLITSTTRSSRRR